MFSLPDTPTDAVKLADWLELWALISADSNASRGDLERALHAASLAELPTDEAVEEKTISVLAEVRDRENAAGDSYPFKLDGNLVSLNPEWEKCPSYVFCLCLSYFGCKEKKGSKSFPRRWFEHISRDAVKKYIGGNGLRFGSPRAKGELPAKFNKAVSFICSALG